MLHVNARSFEIESWPSFWLFYLSLVLLAFHLALPWLTFPCLSCIWFAFSWLSAYLDNGATGSLTTDAETLVQTQLVHLEENTCMRRWQLSR